MCRKRKVKEMIGKLIDNTEHESITHDTFISFEIQETCLFGF